MSQGSWLQIGSKQTLTPLFSREQTIEHAFSRR